MRATVGLVKSGVRGFVAADTDAAGYAFCAIAALDLLDRTPDGLLSTGADSLLARSIADLPGLVRWLGSRTFLYASESVNDEEEEEEEWQESIVSNVTPEALLQPACHPLLGFNGRCNKHADSCYTWWTVGTLTILARHGLVDDAGQVLWEPSRRFLLEETQHVIGGFSKTPGGPPDLYHSYLGLAALATKGEPDLKAFDPAMSVSTDTVQKIKAARGALLRGQGRSGLARSRGLLAMGKACWSGPPEKAAQPVI